ncbi:MAG: hypothetical protein J7L41_08355 [Synergistetes bacterium]|nr:hypothetical protein [Synergistota bacterium]
MRKPLTWIVTLGLVALPLCSTAMSYPVWQQETILGGLYYNRGIDMSIEKQEQMLQEIMNDCEAKEDPGSAARYALASNLYMARNPAMMQIYAIISAHFQGNDISPKMAAKLTRKYVPAEVYRPIVKSIISQTKRAERATKFLLSRYHSFTYRLYHIVVSKFDVPYIPGTNAYLSTINNFSLNTIEDPTLRSMVKSLIQSAQRISDPLVFINYPVNYLPGNPQFCRDVVDRYNHMLPFTMSKLRSLMKDGSLFVTEGAYRPLTEGEKKRLIEELKQSGSISINIRFVTRTIPVRLVTQFNEKSFQKILEAEAFINKMVGYLR